MKLSIANIMAAALMSLAVSTATYAGNKARGTVKIRMIETTDVHGRFFPYDFIRQQPVGGALARVSRREMGDGCCAGCVGGRVLSA